MKHAFTLAVAGTAALAVATLAPSGGSAATIPNDPPRVSSFQLQTLLVQGAGSTEAETAAEKRDAARLAMQTRISQAAAERIGHTSRAITEFSAMVERTYPNLFVGSGLATGGAAGYDAYLTLAGEAPREVIAAARALPIDIQIRSGAPASAEVLVELSASATKTVASTGVEYVQSSINWDTFAIEIEYGGDGADLLDEAVLEQAVTDAASETATRSDARMASDVDLPVGVVVSRNDEMARMNDATGAGFEVGVQGGRILRWQNQDWCTSGFSAVRNGNQGLITAGHCPNSLSYSTYSDVIAYGAHAVPVAGGSIDMQFQRVKGVHTATPKFQAAVGDVRTVTAYGSPPQGTSICKYGFASGPGCSTIYDTLICQTDSGYTACGMSAVVSGITTGGDSGGPWFYGNTAKGTHSGTFYYDFENRSFLTPIGRAANNLNATIMTG